MPERPENDNPPPRFSVVTPSFKQLDWLKLCVASVADQEGVTFEHIVHDAGTGPELESWAASAGNLRLAVERDDGMYDAINRGLRRSRGEICSYLNCDEQYLPGTLKKVSDFFDANPGIDVLFADAVLIDCWGTPLSYRRAVIPDRLHTRLVHLNTLSCATFFRRSVVERGLLFNTEFKAIGDAVWVYTLLTNGVPMAVLPEPLAVFTFTGENLGAAEKSHKEMIQWRKSQNAPPAFLRLPVILLHRLRKFLAGAYFPRPCAIEIYTPGLVHKRTGFSVPRIGFGWPSQIHKKTPAGSGPVLQPPTLEGLKIAAVFTSYNRRDISMRCIERLLNQSVKPFRIVVADNNSTDGTRDEIRSKYACSVEVDLLALPVNLGNSGGIRIAIQRALAHGAHAVWILDDDSWPHPDTLKNLLAHYNPESVFSSLVLDPAKKDLSWPYVLTIPRAHVAEHLNELPGSEVFEVRGAWLGALVSRHIFEVAGLPNERLFIRGEDEEFPLRIRKLGFRFYCIKSSVLDHPSPNQLIRLRIFNMNFFYEPKLASWKAYYMVRNRVFIYRKYSRFWIEGVAKSLCTVVLAISMAVLRDDRKLEKIIAYLRAGRDGMSGRLDKIEPPPAGTAR